MSLIRLKHFTYIYIGISVRTISYRRKLCLCMLINRRLFSQVQNCNLFNDFISRSPVIVLPSAFHATDCFGICPEYVWMIKVGCVVVIASGFHKQTTRLANFCGTNVMFVANRTPPQDVTLRPLVGGITEPIAV